MFYHSTAADVALYYLEMGIRHETKHDSNAERCFQRAVEKANQALENPESEKQNIGFIVYFQYGSYLFRQRRYIDSYIAFQNARKQPCSYSHETSVFRSDMVRMEAEIRSICSRQIGSL